MLHQLHQHVVNGRLEMFQEQSKTAQLKRSGYREIREPRLLRHWANR